MKRSGSTRTGRCSGGRHLAQRWQDLFGAKCDLLLYDLTSTYFEGQAEEIPAARRGYSRDSRPDALQLVLAMVVTEEGLPLSYEVFEGNRADVTTLEEILDSVERKHGKLGRVWVFDRGIVSEENRIQSRVEAHILIAFLGYCLWVCLKQKLRSLGGSLTPIQVLHTLRQILMVEVWFDLRRGGQICLPRITQPEAPAQLTRAATTPNLPGSKSICGDNLSAFFL